MHPFYRNGLRKLSDHLIVFTGDQFIITPPLLHQSYDVSDGIESKAEVLLMTEEATNWLLNSSALYHVTPYRLQF
jgi:hypothetical protein